MTKRRIVVTGMGMLSPLGNSVEESWKNALAGKSGVQRIDRFDASRLSSQIAGTVKNFDASQYMSVKEVRRSDVFIHFAVAAAVQALQDSGLVITEENSLRIGTAIGSGIGGLPMIEEAHSVLMAEGPRRLSPFFIPGTIINLASGYLSVQYKLRGPNMAIVTACSTGAHNIGMAGRIIERGDADVMIAGGTEMTTCEMAVGGFASMRALSTRNDDPEAASRPWDKDRDGFVLGEGAGVIVLEEYEYAKKRGAKIYGELVGFGMTDDGYHITSLSPDGEGASRSMQIALNDAKLNYSDVGYVNAHATSTPMGDGIEANAIKVVFKDHINQLAVSSTKSMTGHLLGAAGAVEAIFSILALRDQKAPPTINLHNVDDAAAGLNLVPNQAQDCKMKVAMSNSFGFGGTNGTLIFKQV